MVLLAVIIVLAVIGMLFLRPVDTASLRPRPRVSSNYEESVERIETLRNLDGPDVADYCHPIFLTHGKKMVRAIVMYHGYTNCPRQYEKLAKEFFKKGYNVYVPRIPHNGLKDLMTRDTAKLTVNELMDVCNRSVDIAQGLGDEVTVLGLSMGGLMAAWDAQFRNDVGAAVVIVPSFTWHFLPGIVKPLINLAKIMPNLFLWWDPIKRKSRQAPHSMYHRFSTKGMGQIMHLGLSVLRGAKHQIPKAKKIILITNDLDIAVDSLSVKQLVKRWKNHGADVRCSRFSKEYRMEHDIIDPFQPYERTGDVYSLILRELEI